MPAAKKATLSPCKYPADRGPGFSSLKSHFATADTELTGRSRTGQKMSYDAAANGVRSTWFSGKLANYFPKFRQRFIELDP
jgi:hypothetical protein